MAAHSILGGMFSIPPIKIKDTLKGGTWESERGPEVQGRAGSATMWRKLLSAQLQALEKTKWTSQFPLKHHLSTSSASSTTSSPFQTTLPLFSANSVGKTRVEDVMPIATGHEKEELQAQLQGKDLLEINHPVGPFGTKESPAIVKSVYDKRIVGCPGGEGEDEHDVVWFWLEKGKAHECPVCSQFFQLEVVGPGGPPDGHGDDDHH